MTLLLLLAAEVSGSAARPSWTGDKGGEQLGLTAPGAQTLPRRLQAG